MSTQPTEAPPSYEAASSHSGPRDSVHLGVPTTGARSRSNSASSYTASSDEDGHDRGLSTDERVSMEDSFRELPPGWTREFDPTSQHFFYVDTKATPPRSIWVHPLDDEQFLNANPQYRERSRLYSPPQGAPPAAAAAPSSSNDSKHPDSKHHFFSSSSHHQQGGGGASSSSSTTATTTSGGKKKTKDDRTLGRKLKDKMTGSTHEERVAQRKRQKEEEMKAYQQYIMRRNELLKAQREGRYQTVYAAPATPYGRPMYASPYSRYGGGYGGGYYGGGYGYGRPGYGMGGAGMGAGMGLLGGLAVGSLLF
ncbi:hypothetical protein JCM3766R1_006511 [Sporobolomyces carnicolor]